MFPVALIRRNIHSTDYRWAVRVSLRLFPNLENNHDTGVIKCRNKNFLFNRGTSEEKRFVSHPKVYYFKVVRRKSPLRFFVLDNLNPMSFSGRKFKTKTNRSVDKVNDFYLYKRKDKLDIYCPSRYLFERFLTETELIIFIKTWTPGPRTRNLDDLGNVRRFGVDSYRVPLSCSRTTRPYILSFLLQRRNLNSNLHTSRNPWVSSLRSSQGSSDSTFS